MATGRKTNATRQRAETLAATWMNGNVSDAKHGVQRASKLVLVEFIVVLVQEYEMSLSTATETVRRWLEEAR